MFYMQFHIKQYAYRFKTAKKFFCVKMLSHSNSFLLFETTSMYYGCPLKGTRSEAESRASARGASAPKGSLSLESRVNSIGV